MILTAVLLTTFATGGWGVIDFFVIGLYLLLLLRSYDPSERRTVVRMTIWERDPRCCLGHHRPASVLSGVQATAEVAHRLAGESHCRAA